MGEGDVRAEDWGQVGVLQDVGSRVQEVEVGKVAVGSLCGRGSRE